MKTRMGYTVFALLPECFLDSCVLKDDKREEAFLILPVLFFVEEEGREEEKEEESEGRRKLGKEGKPMTVHICP